MNNAPYLDFLIRLKNAYLAGNKNLVAPTSKLLESMASLLKKFKLIDGFKVDQGNIKVDLTYSGHQPAFTNVRIYSKPGRRFYQKAFSLPWGKTPKSLIIVSTSSGLMSQKEAKLKGLGGEIFAELY